MAESAVSLIIAREPQQTVIIPSPVVSLKTLTELYDEHVALLNSNSETSSEFPVSNGSIVQQPHQKEYHLLRLTCSIVLAIIALENQAESSITSTMSTLKETAWRCYLLEKYLNWIQRGEGDDIMSLSDLDVSESIIPVEVKAAAESSSTDNTPINAESWYWKLSTDKDQSTEGSKRLNDGDIIISMSRQELEEEEAILIEMASTPIPTGHVQATSHHSNTNQHRSSKLLSIQEKLLEQWSRAFS